MQKFSEYITEVKNVSFDYEIKKEKAVKLLKSNDIVFLKGKWVGTDTGKHIVFQTEDKNNAYIITFNNQNGKVFAKFEYNNKEKTDKKFKQSLFLVPFKNTEEMTEWAKRVFGIEVSSVDINK